MELATRPKVNAKDVFLNLGATIALYTVVVTLLSLLFTVINTSYPQIRSYNYIGSESISWPVATLIIFFPIFIFLMWILGKEYEKEPDRRYTGIHKWLTYLTLFLAGIAMAVDLITILYYFIDGRELTTGFILKILAVLLVAGSIFSYYLADIQGKLTTGLRKLWRIVSTLAVLGSIVWGFVALGSPYTQRMYKYDEEKVNELGNINSQITNYYTTYQKLPETLQELIATNYYVATTDSQGKNYEYIKTSNLTYNICAEFNKASRENESLARPYPYEMSWKHPAGRHCFVQTVNPNLYTKLFPVR